MKKMML
jgi:hypothetical protein